MKRKIILALLACILLSIAVLIYLCFRGNNILFFNWLNYIGFNYSIFQNVNIKPPNFIIYNFTNALFLIFGYIFIYIIWSRNKNYFLFYISLITLLNIIYEIITRDIDDLITIMVVFLVCILFYIRFPGVKYEK